MSADNGFIIKKKGKRKYKVFQYCASLEDQSEEEMEDYGTFNTLEEAIKEAQKEYSEYGLSFDI